MIRLIRPYYPKHINNSYKSICSKKPNLILKWAEDLNKHVSKADRQMANIQMKRCSISLTIREIQIKNSVRYYFTLVKTAIIKKTIDTCWQGRGETEASATVGGNGNWCSHCGKQHGLKIKNNYHTTYQSCLAIYKPKKRKTLI